MDAKRIGTYRHPTMFDRDRLSPGSSRDQTRNRRNRLLVRHLGKLSGMAWRIELHRRLLLGASWFSRRRNRPGVSVLSNIAVSAGLKISRFLERVAWRYLVQREARTILEAEQKSLYVIAAVLARPKTLQEGDVAEIVNSVAKFKGRLGDLLGKVGR